MAEPMTDHAMDERERALLADLAALPRELAPREDYWPAIARRVRARVAQRRALLGGVGLALAASLLFAVVRLSDDVRGGGSLTLPSDLAGLRGELAPEVFSALAANLVIYDRALHELEAHSASEPANSDIRRRIHDISRKRAALLRAPSRA
ncbi:MAG: hypothetical protein ACT4R6_06900 [Gemmatimonadaceae bacterium]